MSNSKRLRSEGSLYHITARGVGRQIIFEDDSDREFMKRHMMDLKTLCDIEVYAWCFMPNHIHLLLHAPMDAVSSFMQRLQAVYARRFNLRHDRVGTLFQGRFDSVPIETDEQLLSTVSYIHRNPLDLGEHLAFAWSSYVEYLGSPELASTSFVLNQFGGQKAFAAFHEAGVVSLPKGRGRNSRLSDQQAKAVMKNVLGDLSPYSVRALEKAERNAILRQLKGAGLSIKQIERETSIGRGIIQRA